MQVTEQMTLRILVSGGAGFIGSHLCEALLGRGHQVLCLDDLSSGTRDNVAHLLDRPHFELLVHDVTEPLDPGHVDQIYNLACPASPPRYQADPIRTLRTSVLGVLSMLELAERCGAVMLQASTSEVYGDPLRHPQSEDYWGNVNPVGLRSCYDEGKRCAETLVSDYRRVRGVDGRLVRIFNTYGPRMSPYDGRVVSNFLAQALRGEPLTVYGDGSQTRSFCYVSDLVRGLMAMMDCPADAVQGPVNLGNPEEHSIMEFARLIIELTGSHSDIVSRPLPADDPAQRRPDITRARRQLGWQPEVRLREGLMLTAGYFAQCLRLPRPGTGN